VAKSPACEFVERFRDRSGVESRTHFDFLQLKLQHLCVDVLKQESSADYFQSASQNFFSRK
jgi:hypothetical protein